MSKAHFRFSTDILRRLGEELNPSPDQGIIELVKNSYDADSINCTIELLNTDQVGGSIRITDDGDGMDEEGIKNGWLVLGKSPKTVKIRTRLGRIPAGSKGLGRLAALRMGSKARLVTRPSYERDIQFSININWSEFDNVNLVNDVELVIIKSKRMPKEKFGTEIIIEDLKSKIGRLEVKRLARALILLADPFGDEPSGFNPTLIAPEFADIERLVKNRYFEDAEYHLVSEVNSEGIASARVIDWKGEELFSAEHKNLTRGRENSPYLCPPARFDIWIYLLDPSTFSTRSTTIGEVRKWLRELGGVHLYENGLRVNPYGNLGNDWLDINVRRAQSPEERPFTNTVIGRVLITDVDEDLIQKTDRSGFIEGDAFQELRSFTQDSLEWLASRRMEVAMERRSKERIVSVDRSTKSKEKLEEIIDEVHPSTRSNLIHAFSAYNRSRDREVRELRREVQLYRTLSTAGITAATFAHESSGNPLKVIIQSIKAIQRRAKNALNDKYDRLLRKPVDSIFGAVDSLAVLGSATLNLLEYEKRRVGRVEIHDVLTNVLETFNPFLDGRDVDVRTEFCLGSPYLRGSTAAIESIITNLINNSLAAFERSDKKERILLIRTILINGMIRLSVLDNGPGIKGISLRDIWLPGKTTKQNGTGLGLTIVHDAVKDLGGEVDAIANSEFGGAEIIIDLPILGA